MKIIVVDSNTEQMDQLVECIGEVWPGAEVQTFTDPLQAVKYAYDHPLNALFTEIPLPVMDGFTLAEMMVKRYPDVEVWFVTGHEQYRSYEVAVSRYKYVMKPVTVEALHTAHTDIKAGEWI